MALSNEWYNAELENSELETLHRSPTVEYLSIMLYAPATWKQS